MEERRREVGRKQVRERERKDGRNKRFEVNEGNNVLTQTREIIQ